MGEPVGGQRQRLAELGDEPTSQGARARDRDLLAEDGPYGDLGAVDRTRARGCRDGGAPAGRAAGHALRASSTAAESASRSSSRRQPGDRGHHVARVSQRQRAGDVVTGRGQGDGGLVVREPQRPAVGRAVERLDAGHRAAAEEVEHTGGVERRPDRQAQVQGAGPAGLLGGPATAQFARRGGEHRLDGVVELPDAREPGGERDLRERQRRGLDQGPGGVGALRTGQRLRPGADLRDEQPVQLPLAVAELAGQVGHAAAVDDTVADEPHRAGHRVGALAPLGGARGGVRAAAAAGPEPGPLSGCRRRQEPDVVAARGHGRAARPAVDAGRGHGRHEPPVEPRVAAAHGAVAGVGVHHGPQPAPWDRQVLAAIGHRPRPDTSEWWLPGQWQEPLPASVNVLPASGTNRQS